MIKRIMITIAILAALTLTGCAENSEFNNNGTITGANDGGTSASFTGSSEVEEPANSTSEVENETSINTSEPVESTTSSTESKPGEDPTEKPVESTSSTVEKPVASTSTTVEKPASSSTTSKPSTPVSSSSTTTSVSTSKPVEKVHNCSIDGHVWNVTTTTTEPKWCREMHDVCDFGFDVTLAERHFEFNEDPYKVFKNTLKEMGINGACGSASIEVEVWGTETYETKECTECGLGVGGKHVATINPIGEWQFKDGVNRRLQATGCDFNTLFYDPYNVPQVVIDNIRIYRNR